MGNRWALKVKLPTPVHVTFTVSSWIKLSTLIFCKLKKKKKSSTIILCKFLLSQHIMLNLLKLIFLMLGLQKLIWVEIGTSFLIINFLKYPANCQCCQDKEMICRVPFQFTRWQDSVSNRAYLHCVSCDCCYTNNVEFCKSHTLKFCGRRFAEYGNKEGNWLHL